MTSAQSHPGELIEEARDGLRRRYRASILRPDLFATLGGATISEVLAHADTAVRKDRLTRLQAAMRWHTQELLHNRGLAPAAILGFELHADAEPDWLLYRVDVDLAPRVDLCDFTRLRLTRLVPDGDVEAQALSERVRAATREGLKTRLFDLLDEVHQIPLPESIVRAEHAIIQGYTRHEYGSEAGPAMDDGLGRSLAERRVKLAYILLETARRHQLEVAPADLKQAVERAALSADHPADIRRRYRDDPQALEALRRSLLEERAVDFILSKAQVRTEQVPIETLLACTGNG